MGIARGDRAGSRAWHDQNFRFFGAPVGLIFMLDWRLARGSLIDLGLFMAGVMAAARGLGLDTCAQAAFASYHAVTRRELGLRAEAMVVCGMALGHADPAATANQVRADRAPLAEFAAFHDGGHGHAGVPSGGGCWQCLPAPPVPAVGEETRGL